MKYTHIIWDWNGTLIDDVATAVLAMNDIFDAYRMPHTDHDEYRALMETPVLGYYAKLFDLTQVPFEELLAPLFHERYDAHLNAAKLADGAVEALELLRGAGCEQAIVSAQVQSRLEAHLRLYGIADYFTFVSGAGDGESLSGPKDQRAADYVRSLGVPPERVVFLGDTRHDLEAAGAAGAGCVLVDGGHEARSLLEGCGAPVVDNLRQAAELLLREGATACS